MSSFQIALNGTTDFISSTKNNDTTYTFPSVDQGTYLMQGFYNNIYLDAFATGVPITFITPVNNITLPLINSVIIQISPTFVFLNLTGNYLENMSAFSLVKTGTTNYITSTRVSLNSYKFASLDIS